ncbi:MAG: hypothetical protein KIT39_07065, partial [Nitrospirales bacterium]|nr:hypothetical protein [Nitrospirales bacterium]
KKISRRSQFRRDGHAKQLMVISIECLWHDQRPPGGQWQQSAMRQQGRQEPNTSKGTPDL